MATSYLAVVPYYFLVWYNLGDKIPQPVVAVVPYYFLVWYNCEPDTVKDEMAVVPYYFLVWYNSISSPIVRPWL